MLNISPFPLVSKGGGLLRVELMMLILFVTVDSLHAQADSAGQARSGGLARSSSRDGCVHSGCEVADIMSTYDTILLICTQVPYSWQDGRLVMQS